MNASELIIIAVIVLLIFSGSYLPKLASRLSGLAKRSGESSKDSTSATAEPTIGQDSVRKK